MVENDNRDDMEWEEIIARIKSLLAQIAGLGYPLVWVGKPGMMATDLLHLQEINDELPEEMQVWPEEFVRAEGTEGAYRCRR